MNQLRFCFSLLLGLSATGAVVRAHSGHNDEIPANPGREIPTIVINPADGKHPWTSLDLNNDPTNFQFAIITDNTAAARPGVLPDAFKKLNWLQPEFVMSVGDLIQGYTEDRAELKVEWDEFEGFVSKLQMPFFYVAGNHDYTNPVMGEVWKERFGPSYYHFIYRDVLFIQLNSNDAGRPHHMTQEQVDWFAGVLAKHPNPRWTLVFTHTPLWNFPDQNLWPQVEALLAGRKHTVFAGHHHRYVKDVRNDANYYTLATTGGASPLRGPRFGEFDHVMWATMTDEGPILANLLLEGIWPEDVRTERTEELQAKLIDDNSIALQPIVFEGDHFKGGRSSLRFSNDTDLPVELKLSLRQTANTRFKGQRDQTLAVPPNEVVMVDYPFSDAAPDVGEGVIAEVDWTLSFKLDDETFNFDGTETIAAVQARSVQTATIKVDGDLRDWPDLPHHFAGGAGATGNGREWRGQADSDFRFGVAADADFLYVGVEVTDDARYTKAGDRANAQDSITVALDARPAATRNVKVGRWPDLAFTLVPAENAADTRVNGANRLPEGTQQVARLTPHGYAVEIAVPKAYLDQKAGEDWREVRVNVGLTDRDPETKGRVNLTWMPVWQADDALAGSGTFRRR